jgi:hypothetical protein
MKNMKVGLFNEDCMKGDKKCIKNVYQTENVFHTITAQTKKV